MASLAVSTLDNSGSDEVAEPPARGSLLQRNLAVLATAGMIIFFVINGLFDVDGSADKVALLRGLASRHTVVVLSMVSFILAQVCSVGSGLGVAWLVRRDAPRLGVIGAFVTTLGAFGHAVYGGLALSAIHMSEDAANISVYAHLLTSQDSRPYIGSFALLGLAGVVGGTLISSIAIFRAHLGPRWIAPLLWAFLLLDFVGSSFVSWLAYVALGLAAVAWIMIIRELLRRW